MTWDALIKEVSAKRPIASQQPGLFTIFIDVGTFQEIAVIHDTDNKNHKDYLRLVAMIAPLTAVQEREVAQWIFPQLVGGIIQVNGKLALSTVVRLEDFDFNNFEFIAGNLAVCAGIVEKKYTGQNYWECLRQPQ